MRALPANLTNTLPVDAFTEGRRRGTQPFAANTSKAAPVAELRWTQLLRGARVALPAKRDVPDAAGLSALASKRLISGNVFSFLRFLSFNSTQNVCGKFGTVS